MIEENEEVAQLELGMEAAGSNLFKNLQQETKYHLSIFKWAVYLGIMKHISISFPSVDVVLRY